MAKKKKYNPKPARKKAAKNLKVYHKKRKKSFKAPKRNKS